MTKRLPIAVLLTVFIISPLAQAQNKQITKTAVRPRVPQTLRMLNKIIPQVSYDETPFDAVMESLVEYTGANIKVEWQVLEDSAIYPDDPVTLQAKDLPLSQVLWLIMKEVGGTDLKLAYRASGNTIILSTEEDLGQEMVIKIYDVRDMLVGTASFQAPAMDPGQAMGQSGGGGGGSQLFQNSQSNQQQQNQVDIGGGPELEKLKEIIMNTIEPDSWAETAGDGTIYDFNGMLIIYNTPLVHQKIGGFVEEEGFQGP